MKNMAELGFNTVKLWAVWNWIEKRPGEFDFSDLDTLVKIASGYDLKTVINIIPEGSPYWSLNNNEDALYKTSRGEPVVYGGPPNIPSAGWPGLCMDKEEVAAQATKFIEATAFHFSKNDFVIAIDVWNEPHLEPMFDYRSELLCYCNHSLNQFRSWLKEKYFNLDNLNKVWFRSYTDWEQVTAPPRFGTWTDMIDWRLFWISNIQRWLNIRVAAARKGAPDKLMQTHVAYSATVGNSLTGGLANELGDEFSLAKEVDIFGLSSFPKWLMGKDHVYVHLLHNEIISEASGRKPFYQVELQGGGGKAGLLGGEVPDSRDITLWNFNSIAAGSKGILYWQYAPEPAGIESPGFGLTGFQGENTERSLAAKECARRLNIGLFDKTRQAKCRNAIYLSRHSEVLCFSADRKESLYAGSINGIYKAAYKNMIPVRFIHEDNISELMEQGLTTVFLPMPLILSPKEITVFKEFVLNGGTLVSEACPGLYDQGGMLDQKSMALNELFGLEHVEIQRMTSEIAVIDNIHDALIFKGSLYRQIVKPAADTKVIGFFADGEPALTEVSYGKGRAVWIGTYAFLYNHENDDPVTQDFLAGFMYKGGYDIIRHIQFDGLSSNESLCPVVRLLESDDKYVLVFINHRYGPVKIDVYFNYSQKIPGAGADGKLLTMYLGASSGEYIVWEK